MIAVLSSLANWNVGMQSSEEVDIDIDCDRNCSLVRCSFCKHEKVNNRKERADIVLQHNLESLPVIKLTVYSMHVFERDSSCIFYAEIVNGWTRTDACELLKAITSLSQTCQCISKGILLVKAKSFASTCYD